MPGATLGLSKSSIIEAPAQLLCSINCQVFMDRVILHNDLVHSVRPVTGLVLHPIFHNHSSGTSTSSPSFEATKQRIPATNGLGP